MTFSGFSASRRPGEHAHLHSGGEPLQAGVRSRYLPWLPPLWEPRPRSQQGPRGPARPGPPFPPGLPASRPTARSPQPGRSAVCRLPSLARPRGTSSLSASCLSRPELASPVLRLSAFPLPLGQASVLQLLCSRLRSCACHVAHAQ